MCDLGNVVIDFSWDRAVASCARSSFVDLSVVRAAFMPDALWAQFEVDDSLAVDLWSDFRQKLQCDVADDVLLAAWNDVFIGVNSDVARLLRELRDSGVRLVAATNTNRPHQGVWESRFAEVLEVFSAVYSSCDVGQRKPDAAFFEHILQTERVKPGDALFIDDVQENIDGAAALGIPTIRFREAAQLARELRDRQLLR
jgi:putative hydrolase of the HAD superfamily